MAAQSYGCEVGGENLKRNARTHFRSSFATYVEAKLKLIGRRVALSRFSAPRGRAPPTQPWWSPRRVRGDHQQRSGTQYRHDPQRTA